ncbi:hypothetical protein KFE25_012943 [Diacronema lutheri]|uniref:Uncharacterized protein n=1 Tax=Diacronema lutheri TaxID=2081491 RepID=A0A8J5X931_DIALT|nr:hypothetical protein KFE25_012943 [Diacronema lutheri]
MLPAELMPPPATEDPMEPPALRVAPPLPPPAEAVPSGADELRAASDALLDELRRELLRPRGNWLVAGSALEELCMRTLPAHVRALHKFVDARARSPPSSLARALDEARAELRALQALPPQPALSASGRELATLEAANEELSARCAALRAQVGAWVHEKSRLAAELGAAHDATRRAREEREAMSTALADVLRRVAAERDDLRVELARARRGANADGEVRAADGADGASAARGEAAQLGARLAELRAEVRTLAAERAALLHGLAAPEAIAAAAAGAPAAAAQLFAPTAAQLLAPAAALVSRAGGVASVERLRTQLAAAELVCARQAEELAAAEEDAQVAAAFYKAERAALAHAAERAEAEIARVRALEEAARAQADAERAVREELIMRLAAAEREAQRLWLPAPAAACAEASCVQSIAWDAAASAGEPAPVLSAPPRAGACGGALAPPACAEPAARREPRAGAERAAGASARADAVGHSGGALLAGPRWRGFLWPRLGYLLGAIEPPAAVRAQGVALPPSGAAGASVPSIAAAGERCGAQPPSAAPCATAAGCAAHAARPVLVPTATVLPAATPAADGGAESEDGHTPGTRTPPGSQQAARC